MKQRALSFDRFIRLRRRTALVLAVLCLLTGASGCGRSSPRPENGAAIASSHDAGNETDAPKDADPGTDATVPADADPGAQPVTLPDSTEETEVFIVGPDVDLTTLSSTMVYSEVYQMMINPEDYLGRLIRMHGTFRVYETPQRNYYACIVTDATACCKQGIEFVLDGDYSYPEDYPEEDSNITVSGIFDIYYEGDKKFCQLIHAQME